MDFKSNGNHRIRSLLFPDFEILQLRDKSIQALECREIQGVSARTSEQPFMHIDICVFQRGPGRTLHGDILLDHNGYDHGLDQH